MLSISGLPMSSPNIIKGKQSNMEILISRCSGLLNTCSENENIFGFKSGYFYALQASLFSKIHKYMCFVFANNRFLPQAYPVKKGGLLVIYIGTFNCKFST